MLFVIPKRASVIKVPTLSFMLLGAWAFIGASDWAIGKATSPQIQWGFALVIAALTITGTKMVHRIGDSIDVGGIFGTRTVTASRAVLGLAVRSAGRYAGIDLDLMTTPHFERNSMASKALNVETFTASGIDRPMRVAKRVAKALGLPEPMVAPWMPDTSVSGPAPRTKGPGLKQRWKATSALTKFMVAVVAVSMPSALLVSRSAARLIMTCATPRPVRGPMFSFTCAGRQSAPVDPGAVTLGALDAERSCWVLRDLIVTKKLTTVVDVDALATRDECAQNSWPAPSAKSP
jgi:hypothetical protein